MTLNLRSYVRRTPVSRKRTQLWRNWSNRFLLTNRVLLRRTFSSKNSRKNSLKLILSVCKSSRKRIISLIKWSKNPWRASSWLTEEWFRISSSNTSIQTQRIKLKHRFLIRCHRCFHSLTTRKLKLEFRSKDSDSFPQQLYLSSQQKNQKDLQISLFPFCLPLMILQRNDNKKYAYSLYYLSQNVFFNFLSIIQMT